LASPNSFIKSDSVELENNFAPRPLARGFDLELIFSLNNDIKKLIFICNLTTLLEEKEYE